MMPKGHSGPHDGWRSNAPLILSIAIVFLLFSVFSAYNNANATFEIPGGCPPNCGGSSTISASTTATTTTTSTTIKTTTTSIQTTTSTQSTTTMAQSTTTATTTVQMGGSGSTTTVGSGPTLPTTSVPGGLSGRQTTSDTTTVITTTIAPLHGSLILTESGLPSGVLFYAYLKSEPSLIYVTNTSVNDSVVFANINTGSQSYVVSNVTVYGTGAGGGFLYQPTPAYGTANITNNHTSTQVVEFVATAITTTAPTTTVQAASSGGGIGGALQNVINTVVDFFSYLFKGA